MIAAQEPSCCTDVLLFGRHGNMLNRLSRVDREHQLCYAQLSYSMHVTPGASASVKHHYTPMFYSAYSAPDKVPATSSGQGGSAGQSLSPATLLHSKPQCQRQSPS